MPMSSSPPSPPVSRSVALPWELATGEQPAERQFQLLIATDVYDAWLVHWPVGTGLDLHDHGGSAGAFAVVAGDLDEDVVRRRDDRDDARRAGRIGRVR